MCEKLKGQRESLVVLRAWGGGYTRSYQRRHGWLLALSLLRIASDVWHELFFGHKGACPPYLLVCCQLCPGLGMH